MFNHQGPRVWWIAFDWRCGFESGPAAFIQFSFFILDLVEGRDD